MSRRLPAAACRGLLAFAVAALFGASAPAIDPDAPTIRLADGAFEVVGLSPETLRRLAEVDLEPLLRVHVAGLDVPMLGRVRLIGDALRFDPRYPPRPGTRYRVVFRSDDTPETAAIEAELAIPEPEANDPTRLVAVYPSSDRLPENLLRFYLHFSAPMARGDADRHLRLLDAEDRPIHAPFLELDEELWDPSGTRFTLLIDPGRIKRGLVPRLELGPVLEAGRSYTLEVGPDWPDAAGHPLGAPFRKSFRAEAADDTPPDPEAWRLESPTAGGRDPLVVTFPEALDHALAGRLIRVVDASGRRLSGNADVSEGETRWAFTPALPWVAGSYRLEVGTALEDVAGNAVGRPFEIDVLERVEPRSTSELVAVPFRIDAD